MIPTNIPTNPCERIAFTCAAILKAESVVLLVDFGEGKAVEATLCSKTIDLDQLPELLRRTATQIEQRNYLNITAIKPDEN